MRAVDIARAAADAWQWGFARGAGFGNVVIPARRVATLGHLACAHFGQNAADAAVTRGDDNGHRVDRRRHDGQALGGVAIHQDDTAELIRWIRAIGPRPTAELFRVFGAILCERVEASRARDLAVATAVFARGDELSVTLPVAFDFDLRGHVAARLHRRCEAVNLDLQCSNRNPVNHLAAFSTSTME